MAFIFLGAHFWATPSQWWLYFSHKPFTVYEYDRAFENLSGIIICWSQSPVLNYNARELSISRLWHYSSSFASARPITQHGALIRFSWKWINGFSFSSIHYKHPSSESLELANPSLSTFIHSPSLFHSFSYIYTPLHFFSLSSLHTLPSFIYLYIHCLKLPIVPWPAKQPVHVVPSNTKLEMVRWKDNPPEPDNSPQPSLQRVTEFKKPRPCRNMPFMMDEVEPIVDSESALLLSLKPKTMPKMLRILAQRQSHLLLMINHLAVTERFKASCNRGRDISTRKMRS